MSEEKKELIELTDEIYEYYKNIGTKDSKVKDGIKRIAYLTIKVFHVRGECLLEDLLKKLEELDLKGYFSNLLKNAYKTVSENDADLNKEKLIDDDEYETLVGCEKFYLSGVRKEPSTYYEYCYVIFEEYLRRIYYRLLDKNDGITTTKKVDDKEYEHLLELREKVRQCKKDAIPVHVQRYFDLVETAHMIYNNNESSHRFVSKDYICDLKNKNKKIAEELKPYIWEEKHQEFIDWSKEAGFYYQYFAMAIILLGNKAPFVDVLSYLRPHILFEDISVFLEKIAKYSKVGVAFYKYFFNTIFGGLDNDQEEMLKEIKKCNSKCIINLDLKFNCSFGNDYKNYSKMKFVSNPEQLDMVSLFGSFNKTFVYIIGQDGMVFSDTNILHYQEMLLSKLRSACDDERLKNIDSSEDYEKIKRVGAENGFIIIAGCMEEYSIDADIEHPDLSAITDKQKKVLKDIDIDLSSYMENHKMGQSVSDFLDRIRNIIIESDEVKKIKQLSSK